jgi:hypothetical protein
MTKLKVCEIDLATGKEIVREMNAAELIVMEADKALKAQEMLELDVLSAAKTAAEAKLTALGLTADDLKALGLGNN